MPASYTGNETTALWGVVAGDLVHAAFSRNRVAFNGTTPTLSLGDDGDVDRFMTTTNMDAENTGLKRGTGAGFTEVPGYLYTAANTIDVVFAQGGSGTAGRADIWIVAAKIVPF